MNLKRLKWDGAANDWEFKRKLRMNNRQASIIYQVPNTSRFCETFTWKVRDAQSI